MLPLIQGMQRWTSFWRGANERASSGANPEGPDFAERSAQGHLLSGLTNPTREELLEFEAAWDDAELRRLDRQADEKDDQAEVLTHSRVLRDRLTHLVFLTIWFVIFALVACLLDRGAKWILTIGVTEATQRPLEWGAHLLMYTDLLLLAIQLLETAGVQAVRAWTAVKKEVRR